VTPRVSVVVPTHDRRAQLGRSLAALRRQTFPVEQTEVIVVADGCSDGTEVMAIEAPLSGTVISQAAAGPAAARNRGAAVAAGELIIFLDDDVEPDSGLVEAHVRAHAATTVPTLVVGYLPTRLHGRLDAFGSSLRGWWEQMFERMRQHGHRFTYADVLSGNCSIPRSLFEAVGGFDDRFLCHEDYELGFRVLRAGASIAFAPDAVGWHDERTSLRGVQRRKRAEGAADVALANAHPTLVPALMWARVDRPQTRRGRALRALGRRWPAAGRLASGVLRAELAVLGRLQARQRWRRLLEDLLAYWYWCGVWEAAGPATASELRGRFGSGGVDVEPLPRIDLQHGLAAAAVELDRLAPRGVVLHLAGEHVGTVPEQPWAEPLAGRHLRRLLVTTFANRLSQVLTPANDVEHP